MEEMSSEGGLSKMTFERNYDKKEAITYEWLRTLTEQVMKSL